MGASPLSRIRVPALPEWSTLRRRLLVAVAFFVVLLLAYMFWFRDSSFVAVERVQVEGAGSSPSVEAALTEAAEEMSTLHVDRGALEAAVADDPSVLSVSAQPDFPHDLAITVDLRRPVGYIAGENGGTLIAADGVVLATGEDRPEGVAEIDVKNPVISGDVADGDVFEVARVMGAAPEPLAPLLKSGTLDSEYGVVLIIDPGIEMRFGDADGAPNKWAAAAAVLADPKVTSATYVDLSVPSRPVSG